MEKEKEELKLELDAKIIENAARDAEKNILLAISQSRIGELCYAYKARCKTGQKLIEKVRRKKLEKPEYSIESITDVIGLRLVTLFRRGMLEVVEETINLILHNNALHPNPFKGESPEEVIIYSTMPAYDDIASRIKNDMHFKGIQNTKIASTPAAYSSIHIVTRVQNTFQLKHQSPKNIPVEIQIRTVFEDAWGEIDHKFGYSLREGKETGHSIAHTPVLQTHLKILKKFSDACAEYADVIYSEALPDDLKPVASGKINSVGSDEDMLERFRSYQIREHLIDLYKEGRLKRDAAFKEYSCHNEDGIKLLLDAANFFGSLASDAEKELENQARKLFIYYAKMNEALCFLTINKTEYIRAAHIIYSSLEPLYWDFPLVKVRLAQVLSKLGDHEKSIEKYREALTHTKNVASSVNGCFPENLPELDYDYIISVAPKLLGYQLWLKSTHIPQDQCVEDLRVEKLNLLQEAYEMTLHAKMGEHNTEENNNNNLLYYAVDYMRNWLEIDDRTFKDKIAIKIPELIKFFESKGDDAIKSNVELLDTLALAHQYFGSKDKSKHYALLIMNLSQEAMEDYDDKNGLLEMKDNAWKILQSNGGLG